MDTNIIKEQTFESNTPKNEDPALITIIKPAQLSKLLKEHGPLAMRHITNLLVQDNPEFGHISSSKQRRLIIQAMEQGDEEHQVLFEKVGWGLWQIKPVDSQASSFEEQRVLMNNLNKRRMDSTTAGNEILPSSNLGPKKTTENQTEGKEKERINAMGRDVEGGIVIHKQLPKAVFLDENAISSDDDDHDDEYKLDARRASSTLYSIKRRTSSVVNRPDNVTITPQIKLDHPQLLPQKGKPLMKNSRGRRRSSVTANKKKLLLSEGETTNHSPTPRNESPYKSEPVLMKVTRSSSVTNDSGLRTTLHYTTDSIHPNNSPLSSTSQTSLISSDSVSDTHSTTDLPPPVSQLSLKSTTPERKHQKTELPLDLDQLILSQTHSTSSQESDTEEEDWSHLNPQELIHKAQSGENTHEIANLLLSLK
ncbi:hypothetical protein MOSE0_N08460 [Monosporozyma servazzii]